ncbi:hypothetical protein Trydic_g16018 [Trypoxylus dichotomus]
MFSIRDKIALVTGAGSGIGLFYVKEMFRNGLRGATIADIDPTKGDQALKEITEEFGPNKAIFIKTDVTLQKEVEEITEEFGPNKAIFIKTDVTLQKEVEAAFKKTIEVFKNLDIVINNAGILNDSIFERQIAVNINGTVYGCLFAWDYLQKYRSGTEGVIVNISSVAGLTGFMSIPIYAATKHAIAGLSKSMGVQQHYDRTKIRVVTICPGVTETPLITDFLPNYCLPQWEATLNDDFPKWPVQKPDIVAKSLIQALTTGTNGSFWIVNDRNTLYFGIVVNCGTR